MLGRREKRLTLLASRIDAGTGSSLHEHRRTIVIACGPLFAGPHYFVVSCAADRRTGSNHCLKVAGDNRAPGKRRQPDVPANAAARSMVGLGHFRASPPA
jgi:hypothetical protein